MMVVVTNVSDVVHDDDDDDDDDGDGDDGLTDISDVVHGQPVPLVLPHPRLPGQPLSSFV